MRPLTYVLVRALRNEAKRDVVVVVVQSFYVVPLCPRLAKVTGDSGRNDTKGSLLLKLRLMTIPAIALLLVVMGSPPTIASSAPSFGLPVEPGVPTQLRSGDHSNGLDFSTRPAAAADGYVRFIPCGANSLGVLAVDHGNGWYSGNYHVDSPKVRDGQHVSRGDLLAELATTKSAALPCGGSWSGTHLHFNMVFSPNGVPAASAFFNNNAVDPDRYRLGGWAAEGEGRSACLRHLDGARVCQWGWINVAPVRPADLVGYADSIVKWDGDANTAWYVTWDLQRMWIPDGGTYNELLASGASGPHVLSASVLDRLPDQQNRWAASGPVLTGNRTLRRGMAVSNGDYRLVMQHDGNLVLIGRNGPVWATSWQATGWRSQDYVVFQPDGNLVTYTDSGTPIWSTGTAGRGGDRFILQRDGNLVIRRGTAVIWASGTNGR